MVAIGTPPSSRPPNSWVSGGSSRTIASATRRNIVGCDSHIYLSKYSFDAWPERRAKVPSSQQAWLMSRASAVKSTMLIVARATGSVTGTVGLADRLEVRRECAKQFTVCVRMHQAPRRYGAQGVSLWSASLM